MTRTWQISDFTEAARARIATARLAAAYGVPPVDRARLTASLGAQLRSCLTKGGTWRLTLETGTVSGTPAGTGEEVLHAVVTPSPEAAAAGQPPWRVTVPCPEAVADVGVGAVADDPAELAQALLDADEDTALVLERLTEQERLVDFHREELQQTNQGVVALHAELDAAGRAQREAFAAERKARTEAENARRRLTFLADASAVLTASLDHHEIVRRLPELLVPEYAASVDVWLFDQDGDRPGPAHAAAAVVAART
ncbi:phosphatase, partial [Streptomyces sp. SID6013]|nr:phosphatase [Streptomyces sp. SID6013]